MEIILDFLINFVLHGRMSPLISGFRFSTWDELGIKDQGPRKEDNISLTLKSDKSPADDNLHP